MSVQPLWSTTDKDTGSTISNGDRTATQAAMNAGTTRSARGVTAGKWYVEVDLTTSTDAGIRCGVANASASLTVAPGGDGSGWTIRGDGNKVSAGNNSAYGNALDNPLRIALDADAGKVWFGEGASTWWGDPAAGTGEAFAGLTGVLHLAFGSNNSANAKVGTLRLVADYAGTPPAGFTAGFGRDATATAGAAHAALSGMVGAVAIGATVAAPAAAIAMTGRSAGSRGDAASRPGPATPAVLGRAVFVAAAAVAAAGRAVLAIRGQPATVVGVGGAIAAAGTAFAAMAGRAAGIAAAALVAVAPAPVAARGLPALAVADAAVAAGPATARGIGRATAVVGDAVAAPGAARLVPAGHGAGLVHGVAPPVAAAGIVAVGQAAVAAAGVAVMPADGTARLAGRPATALAGAGAFAAPLPARPTIAGRPAGIVLGIAVAPAAGSLRPAGRPAVAIGGVPASAAAGRGGFAVHGRPAGAAATLQADADEGAGLARLVPRGRPALAIGAAPAALPVPPPGDLAALLADPQAELEWVAVVEPWDAETGAVVPLRWSVRGMVT
ncbi:MAG: hypothetical protein AB7P02_03450, partial [Alphaproteobacteria bacterium]